MIVPAEDLRKSVENLRKDIQKFHSEIADCDSKILEGRKAAYQVQSLKRELGLKYYALRLVEARAANNKYKKEIKEDES